ncbi:hypothetical protein AB9E13_34445, partial [Rhizobium leguminosarum]
SRLAPSTSSAKIYRDFAAEHDRLQRESIAAFTEFDEDVRTGAYPEKRHLVGIDEAELEIFLQRLKSEMGNS